MRIKQNVYHINSKQQSFVDHFNIFILQTNIIMTGNDSDLGRFRLWRRNQRTILALTSVRVGIGIDLGSCWWNLSQNRLELCNEWNYEL